MVSLWDERGRESLASTISDVHGRYGFSRLAAGLYQVSAGAAGYEPVFVGVQVGESEADPDVTLRLGWTEQPVRVQVVEAGTSIPVSGVRVRGALGESYVTDTAGIFLHSLPKTAVLLTLEVEGFCTERWSLLPDDPSPRIEMERELTFGVRLLVPEHRRPIEVHLEQQPPAGLPARRVSGTLSRVAGDANDEWAALSGGLSASLDVVAFVQGPLVQSQRCLARPCADRSRIAELPICEVIAGATLHGSILDPGGQPLALATVGVFESGEFARRSQVLSPSRAVLDSCERRTTSDSSGAFLLRGLPTDALDLVVSCRGYEVAIVSIRMPCLQDPVVTLRSRDGQGGSLSGRFLSSDDKPLTRSIVRAVDPDG